MFKAKDVMTEDVITLSPSTTIQEAGRLFIEKEISGAPVIDNNGNLIGILTENDLISQNKRFHIPTILRIFDAIIPLETSSKVEKEIKRMTATIVSDLCTKNVITVNEDTPLTDVATIMSEKKVHLIPVLREDKVVGIIGKKDMIRGLSRMER